LVLDFLGLKENDVMKPQEEFLDKWFKTWNFPLEIVLEACKICSLRINEPNFNYIDGILSNWNKNNVKSLKDIESSDTKKKTKNTKYKAPVTTFNSYEQRTYDIKELEKRLLGRSEEIDDEQ
jgi:DnaD/phage-associated family protein